MVLRATLAAGVVFLSGTVAVLEWYVGTCKIEQGMLVCIITALLKNTVVMSLLAGVVFGFTGAQLPYSVKKFFSLLGNAAGPVALFSIGLSLVGRNINVKKGELMWIGSAKLFIYPLATWFVVNFLITTDLKTLLYHKLISKISIIIELKIMARSKMPHVITT
ncbi:MAG: hypothetical protein PVH37_20770 [Desulfobacterales bacterium]|jgi:predicted permease